jgi:uncharacterized phiE125 gp8 family phage protein
MEMPMSLKVYTEPIQESISYEDVIDHLRIDDPSRIYYEQINRIIRAVTRSTEDYLNRALITQTLIYAIRDFPKTDFITLPRPPLQSVDSVNYTTSDSNIITMDSTTGYIVVEIMTSQSGKVNLQYGGSWPSDTLLPVDDAIKITYVAGYGDDYTSVPEEIITAMLLKCGDLWEMRENYTNQNLNNWKGYERLLYTYRILNS